MKPADGEVRKLDAAVAQGFAWTAGGRYATQLITWTAAFVTARLLTPHDFGLTDMAGFFAATANTAVEFGITTAVLQMHELGRRAFAQLHTVSMVFAGLGFGGAVLIAPWLARFFHAAELRTLVIVYSSSFLVTGLQAVPLGLLQKDMDYRRISLSEAVGAVCQAVVMTTGAVMHFSYWAIMAGILVNRAGAALMTIYWKPVWFAVPHAKDVMAPLRMGGHVMVSRVASVGFNQVDGIVIGRTMGGTAVGAYRFALNLAIAPGQKIAVLLMRVTGPLFAKVQTDKAQVRRYYLIFTDALALSVGPLALGLAIVAPDVVALLGRQWAPAATPLRWLAVYAFLKNLDGLTGQALTSLRHTRFLMGMSLFTATVMLPAFLIALHWGTGAVAASWLVLTPLTLAPSAVKLLRSISLSFRDYIAVVGPSLAGVAGMVLGVLLIGPWLPKPLPAVLRLAIQVGVGGALYAAILLGLHRQRLLRYRDFLRQLWKDRSAARQAKSSESHA